MFEIIAKRGTRASEIEALRDRVMALEDSVRKVYEALGSLIIAQNANVDAIATLSNAVTYQGNCAAMLYQCISSQADVLPGEAPLVKHSARSKKAN